MKKNLFIFATAILSLTITGCDSSKGSSHKHTFSDEYQCDSTHHWHPSTCGHDNAIVKEEHIPGTPKKENEVNPTCTTSGGYDLVTYCTVCNYELSREHHTDDALGHNWSGISYVWSDEYSKCTATRFCLTDNTHRESETVNSVLTNSIEPLCESKGSKTFTATFTNPAFEAQTKVVDVSPLGHHWSEVTYIWSEDNSECTASRYCHNDHSHTESETVTSSVTINESSSCTSGGNKTYTATFTNTAFKKQTKLVDTNPTGHNWSSVTYSWNESNSKCTASRYCLNDNSHTQSETVNAVVIEKVDPTCTDKGSKTLKATFTNEAFEAQTKVVELSPTGHEWMEVSYTWSGDNLKCTANKFCMHSIYHVVSEEVDTTYQVITEASPDSNGLGRFTAEFTNEEFETQTKDIVIQKFRYGTDPVISSDKRYVTYGLYPQTVLVNVNDIYATLESDAVLCSNGWYYYNDEYYAKTTAYLSDETNTTFDNGNSVVNGETYWFKCEPISWKLCLRYDGYYFCLATKLLDAGCYYHDIDEYRIIDGKDIQPNNYMYSDIRAWLNNEFYNGAFDSRDEFIITDEVDNTRSSCDSSESAQNKYTCPNTHDKVYLPCFRDMTYSGYGLSSQESKICIATDWARVRGAQTNETDSRIRKHAAHYFTRSPMYNHYAQAYTVWTNGNILGCDVRAWRTAIRPAITLQLENV